MSERVRSIEVEEQMAEIKRAFDAIRTECIRYKDQADKKLFDNNKNVVDFVAEVFEDSRAFHRAVQEEDFKPARHWETLVANARSSAGSSAINVSTGGFGATGGAAQRRQGKSAGSSATNATTGGFGATDGAAQRRQGKSAVDATLEIYKRQAPPRQHVVQPTAPRPLPPRRAVQQPAPPALPRPQERIITRVVHINELVLNDRLSVGNIITGVRANPVIPTLTVTGERLDAADRLNDGVIMSINGQSVLYKTLDEVYRIWGECSTDGFVTLEICTDADVIAGYTSDDRIENSMVNGLFDAL
jgi:hypothetical protein